MKLFLKFNILLILLIIISCSNNKNKNINIIVKNFNIICDTSDLNKLYTNYSKNDYIPVLFIKNTDTVKAKMRIRGDSSREYDKKSLKIVFKKTIPFGETKKINLNSEWTDKSYIRQYISSMIMRNAGIPTFNTNYVKLSINGEFIGLYLQVENIDKYFLERNYLDPKASLYKATKDGACLSRFDEIHNKWEKKTNKKQNWNDLQDLINTIDTTSIDSFHVFLKSNFEYNRLISIFAINMLTQNGSTYYHNYYLYHNINGNGKWQMFPWDLDKTLSAYNWKPYKYHETSSNWESDNPLVEKAILNKIVFADIKTKIKDLERTIFNTKTLNPIIDKCEKMLEKAVNNDSSDQIENMSEWKSYLNDERKFIETQTEKLFNQFNNNPSSFECYIINEPQIKNIQLKWLKSTSKTPVKYKLIYGNNVLLDNEKSKIIENITDTFFNITNLPKGKYYWRVYATNDISETEGFNTKNIFNIIEENKTKILKDTILLKENSPHYINNTLIITDNVTFKIEAGCKLLFSETADLINFGNIIAEGEPNDSIWFLPQNKICGNIISYQLSDLISLNYCNLKDVFLRSHNSTIKILNSSYIVENKSLLVNNDRKPIIWINKGEIIIDNCYFENKKISTGEGMNINHAKATVNNSIFIQMADAIEYINVHDGEIQGNIVINSPDDAIDMNGCSNITVSNNIIINNKDKAISVGTEQYGPSTNIIIKNNFIIGNKCGISVKDSSHCKITNTSFINNTCAIDARLKNNAKQYTKGGYAFAKNCLFFNNSQNTNADKNSVINVEYSVFNNSKTKGEGNTKAEIDFNTTIKNDYNVKNKNAANIPIYMIQKLNRIIKTK